MVNSILLPLANSSARLAGPLWSRLADKSLIGTGFRPQRGKDAVQWLCYE